MIISSSKNVLKMEEEVEVSKKRKFQTDQSDELSLLPLSKHACFANVACSDNTNVSSEIDTAYSMSYVNSTTSMECNNDIEMKEESSGSCGEDKMISFESHLDYIYGTQNLEDFSDKVIENILYLDEQEEEEEEAKGCSSNAAKFVLSSGRWTVNQGKNRFWFDHISSLNQEFTNLVSYVQILLLYMRQRSQPLIKNLNNTSQH